MSVAMRKSARGAVILALLAGCGGPAASGAAAPRRRPAMRLLGGGASATATASGTPAGIASGDARRTTAADAFASPEDLLERAVQKYPESEYVVRLGDGPDLVRAQEDARQKVIAQLEATLESSASSELRASLTQGPDGAASESVTKQFVDRAIVSVKSDVYAAAKPLVGYSLATEGMHYAVAAASKRQIAATWEEEGRTLRSRYLALATRFHAATTLVEASQARCELRALDLALRQNALKRRLLGVAPPSGNELDAERDRVEGDWQMTKSLARVSVTPTVIAATDAAHPPSPPAEDPGALLAERLMAKHWPANTGHGCAGGVGFLVAPTIDTRCQRASIGYQVCDARLRIEGRSCGTRGLTFAVTSEKVASRDSNDRERARARAIALLSAAGDGGRSPLQRAVEEATSKLLRVLGEICTNL